MNAREPQPDSLGLVQGTLETLILRVLETSGSLHGYAIARQIEGRAGGRLTIEEGSLYPALRRLERRGSVQSEWRQSDTGRRARFYTITAAGRKQLHDATATWAHLAAIMNDILGTGELPKPAREGR